MVLVGAVQRHRERKAPSPPSEIRANAPASPKSFSGARRFKTLAKHEEHQATGDGSFGMVGQDGGQGHSVRRSASVKLRTAATGGTAFPAAWQRLQPGSAGRRRASASAYHASAPSWQVAAPSPAWTQGHPLADPAISSALKERADEIQTAFAAIEPALEGACAAAIRGRFRLHCASNICASGWA